MVNTLKSQSRIVFVIEQRQKFAFPYPKLKRYKKLDNRYYQMALFYQSYFPGMAEQFLQTTCSPLISGTDTHFVEPDLGFEVIGPLPVELKEKLLKIFKNS